MRILVVGGGLLGLASALALVERGHRVEVVEAREGVGLETSFANGGMLTPSMSDPWNAPGALGHLLGSFFDPHAALKLRLRALPSLAGWGLAFLCHATAARHAAATLANFRLAAYSVARTDDWRARYALAYEAETLGTLKVFRDAASMRGPLDHARRLASEGLRFEELSAAETVALEPALAPVEGEIAAALHFPADQAGDAHLFCRELARVLAGQGATLHLSTPARGLCIAHGRCVGVRTAEGELRADAVVLAAGVLGPALLAGTGVRLPIRPVKGYSVTVELADPFPMPRRPVIDDARHAAVTPLGHRLRLAGTAEFCGFDRRLDPQRIDNLYRIFAALYPQLASRIDPQRSLPWAHFRPMSSDGRPFIGASALPGLYLNTGHGHLGWTMAAGSGCLLADLIDGRPAALDPAAFAPGPGRA